MFKAFTDNISSFIGGGEKKDDETKPDESSKEAENSQGIEKAQGDTPATTDPQAAESCESAEGVDKKDTKKPPPRPAPPLTPAASVSKADTPPDTPAKSASEKDGSEDNAADVASNAESDEAKKDKIDEKLEEVAEKAKEWGSYLFSMTKSAGASVTAKAKELKKAVADNTIVGDFMKEQDKFVSEKKEKARASEAAVPPWVGYNEEEQMKTQILTLSNDKRNFLRNPPTGVQFHFDYETCYPVAMATLAEDDKLQKMRFELVPKMVTEHDFWRNYFYRVSLIKQSTQLTSLSKQSSTPSAESSEPTKDQQEKTDSTQSASKEEVKEVKTDDQSVVGGDDEGGVDAPVLDAGNDEFISDAYNLEISDEDLMREMEALRASPGAEDAEWEAELQKELTDYEVVGGASVVDDAALEKEIMDEMSKSGEDLK